MKIIINLKGFTLAYQVMVLDNDNITFMTKATIKNIPEIVCELIKKYECSDIMILGNKNFSSNTGENIKNTYLAKYNDKKSLNIEYKTNK